MENELASAPNLSQEISTMSPANEGGNKKFLLIIIILLVVVIVGVLFFKSRSTQESSTTEVTTPTVQLTETPTLAPTSTVTPTPRSSPTPTLSPKQKIKLQILNGTGAAGDAAFLKSKLTNEGYGTFTLGNSDNASSDAQSQVTFYSPFPQNLRIDFVSLLQTLYASVSSSVATGAANFDAVVVTGKKK